jgi:hypothetical protein
MTQTKTTGTQGIETHNTAEIFKHTNVAKPKSCLDYLQATDWETFLVRTDVDELSIFRILLIFDVVFSMKIWTLEYPGHSHEYNYVLARHPE